LYFFDPVKKHYYDIIDTAALEIKGKTTLAMLQPPPLLDIQRMKGWQPALGV
jgi:hypothetical protein